MAKQKKTYEDDDGRTIADMSGVTRRSIWTPRAPAGSEGLPKETEGAGSGDKPEVTREQLRYYILGGLAAAFLIVAVFGIVFAIVIFTIGKAGSCSLG